jgi:hypothetical protein
MNSTLTPRSNYTESILRQQSSSDTAVSERYRTQPRYRSQMLLRADRRVSVLKARRNVVCPTSVPRPVFIDSRLRTQGPKKNDHLHFSPSSFRHRAWCKQHHIHSPTAGRFSHHSRDLRLQRNSQCESPCVCLSRGRRRSNN